MPSQIWEHAAMAGAVPGEDLSPLVAAILRLSATMVKDEPVTERDGWASLPPDLVRRVADCLLDTNDVHYYMDFRAVCPTWRSTTDDPRKNIFDVRFRPLKWIVLAEDFQTTQGKLLLLNADTGLFLQKELPHLGDYYVVATTPGGFCVMADKNLPHAAIVLNPLTGTLIRFAAPMPTEVGFANVIPWKSKIWLISLGDHNIYGAGPDMKSFNAYKNRREHYDLLRDTLVGCVYADMGLLESQMRGVVDNTDFSSTVQNSLDPGKFSFPGDVETVLVGLGAQALFVLIVKGSTSVFEIEAHELMQVKTIRNHAIFIGPSRRYIAVNADNFPGIEANCVYCIQRMGSLVYMCKCNVKDNKVERISSNVVDFIRQDNKFVLFGSDRPFTIFQILFSYILNIPDSQLALQQIS